MTYPWFNFAVALAVGLLIGVERERTKGEGTARRPAGIRTFALAALVGAVGIYLGGIALLAVATSGIVVLAALSYLPERSGDPGLTTEVALIAAPLLGAIAMSDVALASALAVSVAAILAAKTPLHRFVKSILTEAEVNDGLVLAIATVVIWPQLPDRYIGPYAALNPHALWLVIILVLAIGAVGHVATRILGLRAGLPLSGFVAGFASSTITVASMAREAKKHPGTMASAVAGAALSTVATFVQMAVVLSVISRPTLLLLAPSLVAGAAIAVIYGTAFALQVSKEKEDTPQEQLGQAFNLGTGLLLAATMAVMLVAAASLRETFGDAGMDLGAALGGIFDAHAAAASIAFLVASAKLTGHDAIIPILAAMSCNAASKITMAAVAGSRGFAVRIVPGLILSIAGAWLIALITLLE